MYPEKPESHIATHGDADMTEDQIERRVDLLDSMLMSGRLTQAEYDEEMKRLHNWADDQYRILSREAAL